MPRAPRLQDAGLLHHVISRGNDRQPIFKSTADFQKYIALIDQYRRQYPVKIYNYVLMSNHIHLLIEPEQEGSLSQFMEHVSKAYAKYFNKIHNRTGHVFQGRFKSFIVQHDRYYFACSRYIDLNPVKAKIVSSANDYTWSGYGLLASGNKSALSLDTHSVYKDLGANPKERQIAYRALVSAHLADDLELLERRVCVLGDEEFRKKIKGK